MENEKEYSISLSKEEIKFLEIVIESALFNTIYIDNIPQDKHAQSILLKIWKSGDK